MKRTLRSLLLVCTLTMVFTSAYPLYSCAAIRMETDSALFWPYELNPALIPTWPVFPCDSVHEKCHDCSTDSLIYHIEQSQQESMAAVCETENSKLRSEVKRLYWGFAIVLLFTSLKGLAYGVLCWLFAPTRKFPRK